MFEEYTKGTPIIEIKKHLDKKGVLARRGQLFSTGSINKLLTNTHHKGFYVYEDHYFDETHEVKCPPIVNETIWDKAQERRELSDFATRQKSYERL